jgi:hypothetical protein
MEEILKTWCNIKGIYLQTWTAEDRYLFDAFLKTENFNKCRLASLKKWAEKLEMPTSLLIQLISYDKIEDKWIA